MLQFLSEIVEDTFGKTEGGLQIENSSHWQENAIMLSLFKFKEVKTSEAVKSCTQT